MSVEHSRLLPLLPDRYLTLGDPDKPPITCRRGGTVIDLLSWQKILGTGRAPACKLNSSSGFKSCCGYSTTVKSIRCALSREFGHTQDFRIFTVKNHERNRPLTSWSVWKPNWRKGEEPGLLLILSLLQLN